MKYPFHKGVKIMGIKYNDLGEIEYFTLSESGMILLNEKMDKMNKKGGNIGINIIKTEYRETNTETHTGNVFSDFTISGKLHFAGYEIIASIDHNETGNIINSHDGKKIPEKYRNENGNCDHCNTKRKRNKTVIIMDEKTGEYKQIGNNCLAGYIGTDLSHYAYYMAMISDCMGQIAEEDEEYRHGRKPEYQENISWLKMTNEVIRTQGYASKKTIADRGWGTTTNAIVSNYMHPDKYQRTEMEKYGITISDKTPEIITNAIEWVLSVDNKDNDYIYNLQTIVKSGYCKIKHLAYLTSLLPAYNRAMETQKEKTEKTKSQFVGTIGEKINISVNVKYIAKYETQFGITLVYNMTDKNGNIFVWKTGSNIPDGECIIRGTVKAHNEYKGINQTELTRCKIV